MTGTPPAQGDVTVVVATRNRYPDLEQSLPRHEGPVILVDNASDDGTPSHVRESFPDVRLMTLPSNRGAVARNLGVLMADTPYVAFADDDSWWAPGALAEAAACFDRWPRLGLLAGRVLVGPEQRLDPVAEVMAASPLGTPGDLPGPALLGFVACGAVVRREAFLAAGGFDDVVFFRGEEERLALDLAALGWGVSYVDHVVAHHHPSTRRVNREAQVRSARNDILTAVLRRPWPVVARTVTDVIGRREVAGPALAQAALRTPRALRHRRRLPAEVESARRLLDGADR